MTLWPRTRGLGKPASPLIGPPASTQLDLSWTDAATMESGFKIERATSASGPWTQVGTNAANDVTYSDTGLTASTTYYYRVRAYSGSRNGGYSAVVSGTTAAAGPGTLGAKFTSFWSLENTSYTDEVGSHALTPTNTPTIVAAKVANGVNLADASSQKLAVTHADFQPASGVSFAWCGWIKPATVDATARPIFSANTGSIGEGYSLFYTSSRFEWYVRTAGGLKQVNSSGVTPTAGVWYFVVAQFDESADLLRLNVDALTQQTVATGGSAITETTQPFSVGFANSNGQYAGAVIDQMGWALANVLTDAEITYLLNGTSGRTWAEIYSASP